jgi:UDP-N-acetyl-2-amino-2-deoxyglucuronate dehydrogenase
MKDRIRLGLIGCGGIAQRRHLPGLRLLKQAGLDNFDLAACCDVADENVRDATAYAREHLGANPSVYHDWQEMVCKADIDAVDICLPHGMHHVVGISCLEAGLHVLLEKPLAVSIKTGRALAEAADRTGRILASAVPHRRMPSQRAVRWALNDAKLVGEVRTFFQNYSLWRPPQPAQAAAPAAPKRDWRRDRAMGGGASVLDSGYHFFDTIRYFYGEPERVYAEVRTYRDGMPVLARERITEDRENTVMALFTFKSGVIGTWCWSWVLPGKDTRNCLISGSEGSIEDTGYSSPWIAFQQFMSAGELRRGDGTYMSLQELQSRHKSAIGPEGVQRLYPNGVTDPFATEIWDFLDAIASNRKPEVDGWDGLRILALAEGVYESAWSGRAVRIDSLLAGDYSGGWQRDIDAYWDEQEVPRLHRLPAESRRSVDVVNTVPTAE